MLVCFFVMIIRLPQLGGILWSHRIGSWILFVYAFILYGFYQLLATNYFYLSGKLMAFEIYLLFALTIYLGVRFTVRFATREVDESLEEALLVVWRAFRQLEIYLSEKVRPQLTDIRTRIFPKGASGKVRDVPSQQYSGV